MSYLFQSKQNLIYLFPTLVFGLALIILFSISEREELRFSGKYQKPLLLPSQTADLVFMGTSRMRRAIYTPFIDAEIKSETEPAVIWDASFPGKGLDAEIVYLEALVERHKIRKIYLHYYQTSHKGMPKIHASFYRYGGIKDLLFAPLTGVPIIAHPQIRMTMLTKKLDHTLITLFKPVNRDSSISRPEINLSDRLYDNSLPRNIYAERQISNAKIRKKPKVREWRIKSGANRRYAYFLKRFLRLAQARGIEVVLVDLPKFHHGPLSNRHIDNVRREFGVEYITAFPQIDKSLDYGDRGHFNIRGALKMAPIVSGQP